MDRVLVSQYIAKEFQTLESIKALRTNLMFCGDCVRAIALTSFGASSGKTTLSLQLAASFAQAGKRVLLMDGDLRKRDLSCRLYGSVRANGLSHVLSGSASIKDALYKTDIPGLYILFAGARAANAAELLGNGNLGKLIAALKGTFDYIIVDTAPAGQVIDCAVLAPETDGVVMVVDVTHNSYKLERRVKTQLEKCGAKLLGVILNRVDFRDKGSYYGKAYGYGGQGQ